MGGKCYKDGALVTDGVSASIRPPSTSPSLPPALANVKLDEAAEKRLAQFRADFDAKRRNASQFVSKFFHS